MWPVLFQTGKITIYSLGVAVAVGWWWAFFLIWRRWREKGIEEEQAVDVFLASSFWGVIFSRLGYVFLHWPILGLSVGRWLNVFAYCGFSFEFGLAGFLMALYFFCRREKWPFWRLADEAVFGLAPLGFWVELGAFLDGAGLGAETGFFWGIFFPGEMIRRHPISLIAVVFYLLLTVYFGWAEKRWRGWQWYKSQKEGFLFFSLMMAVAGLNFWLAFLRPPGLYSTLIEILSLVVWLWGAGSLYFFSGRELKEEGRWFKKDKRKKENGQTKTEH